MTEPYKGSVESFALAKPKSTAFYEGDQEITWEQYDTRANGLAATFSKMGLGTGDRIAVRLAIRHEWFIVHLAAAKIGASLVGLDSRSTLEEAAYLLDDSAATGFVLDATEPDALIKTARERGASTILSFASSALLDTPTYDQATDASVDAEPLISTSPTPLILYTSGTTGRPKGVFMDPKVLASRPNVQAYREVMAKLIPVDADTRFLLNLPLHHGAGPNSTLFALRSGGSIVIQQKFDPLQVLELVERFRVTSWMAVPSMVHRLIAIPKLERNAFDRSSMRSINIGAAAVPYEIKAWALEFFGPQCLVFEGYGMSETQMISYMLPSDWDHAPHSSGRPMQYVDVKIQNLDGEKLGPNDRGEICARTPLTIDRYFNRPLLGPEDLTPDGYFRTGDIGYLDNDGYLYVTDRLKDMVIVGGANVYPAEIEAVLQTHPAVMEAAVIGVPHADLGEQLMAFCELNPGQGVSADALIDHCRKSLAANKVPRVVEFVEELPRNATGKVTKPVLREPYWEGSGRKI